MAAGGTTANIHIGPGRLYFAPLGTAEPTSASTALDVLFLPIGYTEEGTQIETDITSEAIMVAEELDPVINMMTGRITKITFTMAEVTISRLALALGAGATRLDNSVVFDFPVPSAIVPVMFVWDSAESPTDPTNRRWVIYSAIPSGSVSVARRKAPAKASFPVTFNCGLATGKTTPIRVWPGPSGRV